MSNVTCVFKASANVLTFQSNDGAMKDIPCVLDGTFESKSIRLYNHFSRMFSLFCKVEKKHLSFVVDEKKVLVRKTDLNLLNSISCVVDIDQLESSDRKRRLFDLITQISPASEKAARRRRPIQKLATALDSLRSSQHSNVSTREEGLKDLGAVAGVQSISQNEQVSPCSTEGCLDKVCELFEKYRIRLNPESTPKSLEGRVIALLDKSITSDTSLATIFQGKIVGYQKGGKILVGDLEEKPFKSGGNGHVYKASISVIDSQTGKVQEKVAVLKKPNSISPGSSEMKREWKITQLASNNHSVAIKPIAPVVNIETEAFEENYQGVLLPLFDGNIKDYLEKMILTLNIAPKDRPKRILPILKSIAEGLSKYHQEDIIHNDIKIENVFVKYDKKNSDPLALKKVVLGDWSNTMKKRGLSVTSIFTAEHEYLRLKELFDKKNQKTEEDKEEIKQIRKRIDVRQFAFMMHEMLGSKKVGNNRVSSEHPCCLREDEDGNEWPVLQSDYRELPVHVPKALRQLIFEM